MHPRIAALFASGAMILSLAGIVNATPYTGADIQLAGANFSDSSGWSAAAPVSGAGKWYNNGDAVYTFWGGLWVEYKAFLTPGNWNIGLNAINFNNALGPQGWYPEFQVKNSLNNQTIHIPASATEVKNGFINVNISTAQDYTVRYTWLNDQYASPLDANIQINSVFFDNTRTPQSPVPEPTTILLLGTGLTGLILARKRKIAS